MREIRRIIILAGVVCMGCAYVGAYFRSVERARELPRVETVDRSGSHPPNPRAGVEITTEGYFPMYSSFSAGFFSPMHYIDRTLIRPTFWAQQRTEKPATVRH